MRALLPICVLGIVIGVGLRDVWLSRPVPASDDVMMFIVFSDNTVRSGKVSIDRCVALTEMALDGKVFQLGAEDDDGPVAVAMTCAPAPMMQRAFGRRQTP